MSLLPSPSRPVTEPQRTVPVGLARKTAAAVRRLRANFVFGALLVLFGALVGKCLKLQVVDGAVYRDIVRAQTTRLPGTLLRGAITDVHGRVLAVSRPVRNARVQAGYTLDAKDPTVGRWVISDVLRYSAAVSDLLEGRPTAAELRIRILSAREAPDLHTRRPQGVADLPIRTNVDDPQLVSRLDEANVRGLLVEWGDRRDYPNGAWGGYYVGRARAPGPGRPLEGVEGAEAALEDVLAGRASERARRVQVDGRGKPFVVRAIGEADGRGLPVRLAMDVVVQGYCEQALDALQAEWKPQASVAIVLDPATGDVLASAVRPGYDPSDDGASPQANWAVYRRGVEVGSTFKPFTVCRALSLGVVRRDERLDMPHERTFEVGRVSRTIHDAHDAGELAETGGTVRDLIAQSSNTGTAELSNRMGAAALRRLFDDLELEQPTGALGFPLGREGRGAYPKEGDARPWGATDHLVAGFGHLATITPLRLACAFAAFARDDFRPVRPRLVRSVGADELPAGEPYATLCPDAADRAVVRDGLRRAVTEGTAAKAFAGCAFPVAGKTGTAKKPDAFGPDRYYSASFVGYAPADAPRVVVLVMAIEPRLRPSDGAKPYGAAVAGPAARRIVERTLGEYMGVAPTPPPVTPSPAGSESDR